MNIRAQNPILVLTLLIAVLLTASCTIGDTGIGVNIRDGRLTANISIGQKVINKLIARAGKNVQVDQDSFVKEVRGVNLIEPNTIRIDGVFRVADNETSAGTIDFTVAAAAGTIRLEVAAVDADGLSLDTPAIRELNNQFAKEFAKDVRSQRRDDGGGITNVSISDGVLKLTISESLSN